VESGVRGQYGSRLVYQLAAYDMFLHDDIISFQAADGQSIATNAGETRHRGVEGSVGAALSAGLRLDVAWSVSRQKYVSWVPQAATPATATKAAQPAVSFGGNLIEQAPSDLGNVLLTWTPRLLRGGRLAAEYSHAGRYAMDPQNTHFYGGHDLFTLHGNVNVRQNAELFARVVNVSNANYAEVATYNTFQKEQYNPGTPRSVYAGLRYNWR
jgi:outer membrane cobalamin receptor